MRALAFALALFAAANGKPTRLDAESVGGPIRAWVVHVDERVLEEFGPAHRDLIAAVPEGVRVFVGVSRPDADTDLRPELDPDGRLGPRLRFLDAQGELTSWARDRYLVLGDELLLSNEMNDPFLWPSDRRVGELFAERVLRRSPARSHLFFEGGDIVLGGDVAFVGRNTIEENARLQRVGDVIVIQQFGDLLGRRVVVVGMDTAPPHEHCDMFLSVIGQKRVLVGDPKLTRHALPIEQGFRELTQMLRAPEFDRIAAELRAAGFEVERIPLLIGDDGNFRTWNNAVTETRADGFHAYVPRYGYPALDREAHAVWQRCGFKVHPISCAGSIVHGGAIRCLTHTVRGPLPVLERAATVGDLEPAGR